MPILDFAFDFRLHSDGGPVRRGDGDGVPGSLLFLSQGGGSRSRPDPTPRAAAGTSGSRSTSTAA